MASGYKQVTSSWRAAIGSAF
ncbi:MAG: hypothetical protein H6R42_326, partial [Nitrospirae bacterium]|nr:hypothetical protein [Nitrospirota bacterium]